MNLKNSLKRILLVILTVISSVGFFAIDASAEDLTSKNLLDIVTSDGFTVTVNDQTLPSDITLELGSNFKLAINYKIDQSKAPSADNNFEIYYDLPAALDLSGTSNGVIYDDTGKEFGSYRIEDHRLIMNYNIDGNLGDAPNAIAGFVVIEAKINTETSTYSATDEITFDGSSEPVTIGKPTLLKKVKWADDNGQANNVASWEVYYNRSKLIDASGVEILDQFYTNNMTLQDDSFKVYTLSYVDNQEVLVEYTNGILTKNGDYSMTYKFGDDAGFNAYVFKYNTNNSFNGYKTTYYNKVSTNGESVTKGITKNQDSSFANAFNKGINSITEPNGTVNENVPNKTNVTYSGNGVYKTNYSIDVSLAVLTDEQKLNEVSVKDYFYGATTSVDFASFKVTLSNGTDETVLTASDTTFSIEKLNNRNDRFIVTFSNGVLSGYEKATITYDAATEVDATLTEKLQTITFRNYAQLYAMVNETATMVTDTNSYWYLKIPTNGNDEILTKTGTVLKDDNNFVTYTIKVNKGVKDLDVEKDTLTLVDTLPENTQLNLNTITIKDELGNIIQDAIVSYNSIEKELTFTVPDSKYVIITVQLRPLDESVRLSNTITLVGSVPITSTDSNKYNVSNSYAGAGSVPGVLNLHKIDSKSLTTNVSGATYGLFKLTAENPNGEAVKDADENDVTKVTNYKGIASFSTDGKSNSLIFDTVYYVQELVSPEGYKLDNSKYYFALEENLGTFKTPSFVNEGINIATFEKSGLLDVSDEKIQDANLELSATKMIKVDSGYSYSPSDNEIFNFKISSVDYGTAYEMTKTNSNDVVNFDAIPFTYENVGKTYNFKVEEVSGLVGYTLDSTIYNVKVEVLLDESENVVTKTTISDNKGSENLNSMEFINTINSTNLQINVEKMFSTDSIKGYDKDRKFDTRLFYVGDENLQSGISQFSTVFNQSTNGQSYQEFEVSENTAASVDLTFTKAGTYEFRLEENLSQADLEAGYTTTDEMSKANITVVVEADSLGQLSIQSVSKTIDEQEKDLAVNDKVVNISITNKFALIEVEIDPSITKIVAGNLDSTDSFIFKLTPISSNNLNSEQPSVTEPMFVTVKANSSSNFAPIKYYFPGIYEYEISEVNDGQAEYIYDSNVYKVVVTITLGENAQLEKDIKYYLNDEEIENVEFTNQYKTFEFSKLGSDSGNEEVAGAKIVIYDLAKLEDITNTKFNEDITVAEVEAIIAEIKQTEIDLNADYEWISTDQPYVIHDLLVNHKYIMIEEGAPAGYAYTTSILFTVNEDGSTSSETTLVDEATVINVNKVDENGVSIPGAKFELYSVNEDGTINELLASWTSTEIAQTLEKIVTGGEYYVLHELSAPQGYAVSNDLKFGISKSGQVIGFENNQIDYENKLTEINISKVNVANVDIAGATLELLDVEGNVVESWVSDGNTHVIYGLIEGTNYTLHEVTAPIGYVLADDINFNFESGMSVVMIDNAAEVLGVIKTPSTSTPTTNSQQVLGVNKIVDTSDTSVSTLLLMLLMINSMFGLLYVGFKKSRLN